MTASAEEEKQYKASWKRLTLFSLLFILLTVAGFYAIYDHFSGRSLTFDARLLSPPVIGAVLLLLGIYFTADGLRLYYTLRALGYRIPKKAMAKLVFINIFFSNITPMATGGGFAQVWFLHEHGVPIGRATAATTIRTVLAIFFIFSLTPLFLLTLKPLQDEAIIGDIGAALAVLIVLYLLFFAIVLLRAHWLIGPLSYLCKGIHKLRLISPERHLRWQYKTRREMLRFSRSFSEYCRGSKMAIALSVFFTFIFLLSLFSFPALLMWGLDYNVDYLVSVGLLVVTTFIMYFAPTPGASGISEGVFGSFFNDILANQHLLLVTFSWRFLTIYLGMLLGLVILQRYLVQSAKVRVTQ
ncbi:lysylphosphatidylglycerol synthase transmembrane domain-containing protein [Idiomarina sp. HP20-50]|uniref:lysylphosphatidylglycerol synthase transmembrane domain-containing protein n=1 Tax=Idiomarina sp. HP20-50 TaxID=3070813 RepID=UPI00294B8714|nr:lysylphosphatidylglycerol synthase transmembrane domain-containing protein [Idiomarina sp. HP20-50]MDV6316413.1 lysylphosphatidylglycerol synthase transmembrane domain-containing protein [Idiomarina sp. HP20-50]